MRIACVPSSPMRYIVSMRAIEPPADPAAKRPGETHAFSVVRGSCASSEAMLLTCCRSVSVCIGPCAFLGESDGFAFSASLTVLHAVLSGSSDTGHRTPRGERCCSPRHPATRYHTRVYLACCRVHGSPQSRIFCVVASPPFSPAPPLSFTHGFTPGGRFAGALWRRGARRWWR